MNNLHSWHICEPDPTTESPSSSNPSAVLPARRTAGATFQRRKTKRLSFTARVRRLVAACGFKANLDAMDYAILGAMAALLFIALVLHLLWYAGLIK